MRGSEFSVYCDSQDYQCLLTRLREVGPLSFTETLSQLNDRLRVTDDPVLLMGFLRTKHPEQSNTFLVTPRGLRINSQTIAMQDGTGSKERASQALNPNAVLIKLGGELDGSILVCSTFGTTGETGTSKDTFAALKKMVKSLSMNVNRSFVMPGAFRKLQAGWRLTPDPGFSRDLDIAIPLGQKSD